MTKDVRKEQANQQERRQVRPQPEQNQQGRDIHEAERRQPPLGDRGGR